MGVIFRGYESCAHSFVYSTVRGYNEFYNQYKEILEASYREKKEKFRSFTVSVMKDKEIIHILIAPSSCGKL